jgi:hypothetical protein
MLTLRLEVGGARCVEAGLQSLSPERTRPPNLSNYSLDSSVQPWSFDQLGTDNWDRSLVRDRSLVPQRLPSGHRFKLSRVRGDTGGDEVEDRDRNPRPGAPARGLMEAQTLYRPYAVEMAPKHGVELHDPLHVLARAARQYPLRMEPHRAARFMRERLEYEILEANLRLESRFA